MRIKLCLLLILTTPGWAQTTLPLGAISKQVSVTCPTGFNTGFSCQQITISCAGNLDITPTVGYIPSVNPKGPGAGKTVFVMKGGPWSVPGNSFSNQYQSDGYAVVLASWPTMWFDTGKTANVMTAACRPSTLLDWVYRTYAPSGLRVHAGSGGSGALAYAFSWYGLSFEVVNAEITTGPTFSNLVEGCEIPQLPPVTVMASDGATWTDPPLYGSGNWTSMSTATGFPCGGTTNSSPAAIASWAAQSTLAPGAVFDFPGTKITAWLCETAQTPNNSSALGYLWLRRVPGTIVNAVLNCAGNEGVAKGTWQWNGESGLTAIVADMESN
jgi:hypothetical protein